MFQATCSNAGKSLLATALCRVLHRLGLRVSPFKAQNMSLNSSVTRNGEEIGRAQALQAEACGREPDARMNPVLLKPTGDLGSQVLVLGRPWGTLHAKDYTTRRRHLWEAVQTAYLDLASENDVIVLEGAGSPAEINLRANDIVNMRMAHFAEASVLLIADIDRGGAFAALTGTMDLLSARDRSRIRGFLLNKFRGDASLLTPALQEITRRTRRPFAGTVPWIPGLSLPDEDSVSFKLGESMFESPDRQIPEDGTIDLAVIDLPHISNSTDIDALCMEPDVRIRRTDSPGSFGSPDCVLLPGSRNTAEDLRFLKATQLDRALSAYAETCLLTGKGMLIGICGGFQMLGRIFEDPLSLESTERVSPLGILPIRTRLCREKLLARKEGWTLPSFLPGTSAPVPLRGYEIHHGQSEILDGTCIPILEDAEHNALGYGCRDAAGTIRIWGTYLHGLFDTDQFRNAVMNQLRRDCSLAERPPTQYLRNTEIDRLADIFLDAVPLQRLFRILGLRSLL